MLDIYYMNKGKLITPKYINLLLFFNNLKHILNVFY